jgi:pimeloyl-ACP methyl ester carboxylesterase
MNHPLFDPTGSQPEPPPTVAAGTAAEFGHPLLELRWYGELARLVADPVMCGRGVRRGDGRSVLLLPGFLAGDSSLSLLALFLRRIGYRPIRCGIRFNSGCFTIFDRRMVDRLVGAHDRSGRRVAIIGHSRGGHYARSLAARIQTWCHMWSPWAPDLKIPWMCRRYATGRPSPRRPCCTLAIRTEPPSVASRPVARARRPRPSTWLFRTRSG